MERFQKVQLKRGTYEEVFDATLEPGEIGVSLETGDAFIGLVDGKINLLNRNTVYSPINHGAKSSGNFLQISGAGTLTYNENGPSKIGKGCFEISGDGVWVSKELYAVGPASAVGGHIEALVASGSATLLAGARFYSADKITEVIGVAAQQNFLANSVVLGTSYAKYTGILANEGVVAETFPANTRWMQLRIETQANGDVVRFDNFLVYPGGFSTNTTYA